MAWLDGMRDIKESRERAEKALRAPIGLMSPLWFAFGAAASAGVAWWWMTRWARPVNIEAAMAPKAIEAPAEVVAEALAAPVAVVEPETPAPAEAAPEPDLKPESAVIDAPTAVVETADDLTALAGIGPKIAQALIERGVTRFAHLAAWTEDQLAAFDAELSLKGRAIRSDFVGQARQLIAEHP